MWYATRTMSSTVTKVTERGWEGIEIEGYRAGTPVGTDGYTGVERHTIIGSRKNDRNEPGPAMELRYFELQPGAVSRLEKHEHEHYVIVRRGHGYAVIEETVTEIEPNDVIYVGPLQLHQFVNRGNEPFGFYCFVDACRDFPQQPTEADLARLAASPAGPIVKPFAVPAPVKR